jgi:hypothetical protein
MSTANEILMLRADTLRKIESLTGRLEREMMPHLLGMQMQVMPDHMKDLATIKKHKVEKLPIKKRRKGYRVVSYRVPCAFVINTDCLKLSPFQFRMDLP